MRPIPLRRERSATQARESPDRACTTRAPPREVALRERACQGLNPPSAAGVDRVRGGAYQENLDATLQPLPAQLVTATDRPPAGVRWLIPQGGGKVRPRGRPAREDTSGATAVAMRREAIDEQDFDAVSHGVRPGRPPHHARHEGRQGWLGSRSGEVMDGDSSAFFAHGEHGTRWAMRHQRVHDGRGRNCIELWRKAGRLDGTERGVPDQGSPQGAGLSPVLATAYGHDVLDPGCATVGTAHGRGPGVLARDADDGIIGGALAEDARRIKEVRPQRVATYGLEINADKTQRVACRRPQRPTSGGPPGTCSVLGLVPEWGQTWRGGYPSPRKPEGKRLRRTVGACGRWCRANRHRPHQAQDVSRGAKRRGASQYDGVRWHSPCRDLGDYGATRAWRYWLHRRGGRQRAGRALGRMRAADVLPRPQVVNGWG